MSHWELFLATAFGLAKEQKGRQSKHYKGWNSFSTRFCLYVQFEAILGAKNQFFPKLLYLLR